MMLPARGCSVPANRRGVHETELEQIAVGGGAGYRVLAAALIRGLAVTTSVAR